jgi:hypothetical protein
VDPGYHEPPTVRGERARPREAPRAPVTRSAPIYEPPTPDGAIYEPPPPPEPNHVAPRTALNLAARVGYWVPFGGLYGHCTAVDSYGYCTNEDVTEVSNFARSGPAVELNLGMRLARRYVAYVAWERAFLRGGRRSVEDADDRPLPRSDRAETDFFGLGVRFGTDPDALSFQVDLALGFRTLRVFWDEADLPEGAPRELRLTQAPFEFRMGAGADVRVSPEFSLFPMVTLGTGLFRSVDWVYADGSRRDAGEEDDQAYAHGWLMLGLGGNLDIAIGSGKD